MPKKRESDTLAQRRKAQADIIELKRMKEQAEQGTAATAEKKEKPKRKFSDFWYYNKFKLLAIVLATALISFAVADCIGRTNPDVQIVVYDNNLIPVNYIDEMTNYFESICPDLNGDGKVSVTLIDCTYQTGVSAAEYQQTKMQKLQSVIAADRKATLFITGEESYGFINGLVEEGFLEGRYSLPDEMYERLAALGVDIPPPSNLYISKRIINGTLFEGDKEAEIYSYYAEEFLKVLEEQKVNSYNEVGN